MAARKELVPSVSAQEQETYRRLQSQFSAVKDKGVKKNGTNKGKEVYVNGGYDDVSDGGTWVGQKSVQKKFSDDAGDKEYHSLYPQG
jgi:hypothetical protein